MNVTSVSSSYDIESPAHKNASFKFELLSIHGALSVNNSSYVHAT